MGEVYITRDHSQIHLGPCSACTQLNRWTVCSYLPLHIGESHGNWSGTSTYLECRLYARESRWYCANFSCIFPQQSLPVEKNSCLMHAQLVRTTLSKVAPDLILRLPDGLLVPAMEANGVLTPIESAPVQRWAQPDREELSTFELLTAEGLSHHSAVLCFSEGASQSEGVQWTSGILHRNLEGAEWTSWWDTMLFNVIRTCVHAPLHQVVFWDSNSLLKFLHLTELFFLWSESTECSQLNGHSFHWFNAQISHDMQGTHPKGGYSASTCN